MKNDKELREAGIRALARELGPVEMARFLQLFETGSGDYTAERQRKQDDEAQALDKSKMTTKA